MASIYEFEMQHTEESFRLLSHMQYDLFCRKNRAARTIISLVLMVAGIANFSQWWGILLVAYGCYLTTSTYTSANRTAHKLAEQIKNNGQTFPASRYVFKKNEIEIYSLPEKKKDGFLAYSDIRRMGEDVRYFYIFCSDYGGYMIPKESLRESASDFRDFLEGVAGKKVKGSRIPIVRLINWMRRKKRATIQRG